MTPLLDIGFRVGGVTLRLYAQSTSKHRALKESLNKAKSRSKHWEWKVKEGIEKMTGTEEERDNTKSKAQVARLATVIVGDAKGRVEDNLTQA